MEKSSDKSSQKFNLRNKEIKILLPGHFDLIHAGHAQLIQDTKNAFKRVHLVLGIINDERSNPLLDITEKIETFRNFEEIDEIIVLTSPPILEDLEKLSMDYIATANPEAYNLPDKVLKFKKKLSISTDELIARVVRDYDFHVDNLLQLGYHHSSLKISKANEISIMCKRKVKHIKQELWRKGCSLGNFEDSVDSSRRFLQRKFSNWTESHEKVLMNWLRKFQSSTTVLFTLLKEIWDGR